MMKLIGLLNKLAIHSRGAGVIVTVSLATVCNAGGSDTIMKNVYLHDVKGEVVEDDIEFRNAREECRAKASSQPIYINGKAVVSQSELLKVQSTYFAKKNNDNDVLPAHILEIGVKQKEFIDCIVVDKGYKLIRVDVYDNDSGKLVSSIDMRDARDTNY